MSIQTIQTLKPSKYNADRATAILSCGCDYAVHASAHIGDKVQCVRCPIPVAGRVKT